MFTFTVLNFYSFYSVYIPLWFNWGSTNPYEFNFNHRLHVKLTAIDVMEDFENSLSASLNFLLRLSALLFVFLLLAR